MKIKINQKNPEKEKIKIAINALRDGKTILYPTDTVYGIGANIFDVEAVKRVYIIKNRALNKPLSICVSKIDDIHNIAYLDKDIENMLKDILPGPFTVILNKKENVPPILTSGSSKIGIRIPDNKICMELSREFPITTTSANISGQPVLESINEILKQLHEEIDLVLDSGNCRHGTHSTVLDMTIYPPKMLRKGAALPDFHFND